LAFYIVSEAYLFYIISLILKEAFHFKAKRWCWYKYHLKYIG